MSNKRTLEEMAALIAKRRQPKTEETKQKIREGNIRFWAKAKEMFEQQQTGKG